MQQLFQYEPNPALIKECLNYLGFVDIKDKRTITKMDMEKQNVNMLFKNNDSVFVNLYRPCKYKLYCHPYTIKNCITITRQLLKTVNYELVGKEVMVGGKKTTVYKLMSEYERYLSENFKNGMPVETRSVIVSFD